MYIKRTIENRINKTLFRGKVIVLYGPRQCGKTTLVKHIISEIKESKYFLCEIPEVNEVLTSSSPKRIIEFFGDAKLIVLDEAQTVKNIGRVLKLLVDVYPEKQIIATGSSSFDLSNEIVEPLTGRKFEYTLLPLSLQEILGIEKGVELQAIVEQNLIFGQYPGVYTSLEDKGKVLIQEIASSYLFKDILAFQNIKNSELLTKLLQMLALQIGSEVSYTEIANSLGVDKMTVQKYIELLEKIFVIHRLTPFSRNLRNELNKKRKIYFYDLGIRNAVIRNFNDPSIRQDSGAIWENYCVNERYKFLNNNGILANRYFWRTWEGEEIDYIEEREGHISAYEFKLNIKNKITKAPRSWENAYKESSFQVIDRSNILNFFTNK